MVMDSMPFMVIAQAQAYMTRDELDLVNRAMMASELYHYKQERQEMVNGKRKAFFTHPLAVADFLVGLKCDGVTVAAGFLHDVVEDVEHVSVEDIALAFGQDVANLVQAVTKVKHADGRSCQSCTAEQFDTWIAKDRRALLVKAADRYHNLQTLRHLPGLSRQRGKVDETLTVYVPLARAYGEQELATVLEAVALEELKRIEREELTNGEG